jgi:hypothetical protein
MQPGQYYLYMVANYTRDQGESDGVVSGFPANNVSAAMPITLSAPDLAISNTSAPTSASWNQSIPVTYTVTNTSSVPAPGTWYDYFYLSRSQTFNLKSAYLVSDVYTGNLSPQESPLDASGGAHDHYTATVNFTIPSGLGTGQFYGFVVTNSNHKQGESDSTGNVDPNNVSAALPITIQAPDLVVQNLTTVPSSLQSGNVVTIHWQDANIGQGSTEANNNVYYMRGWYDNVVVTNTTTNQVLANVTFFYDVTAAGNGDIAPGGAVNRQYQFSLPDGSPGTGNIKIAVDTNYYTYYVPESNTSNNTTTINETSTLSPLPDLTVTNIGVAPSPLGSGDVVTVSWHDSNSGTGPTVAQPISGDTGAGLLGYYYGGNENLTGRPFVEVDSTVNRDFVQNPSVYGIYAQFSARWLGQVTAQYTEPYTFTTYSDDGARLWVNDQLVVNAWYDQGATYHNSGTINLVAGHTYDIHMEYYENGGGGANAGLYWSSPSTPFEIIPSSQFSHPTTGGYYDHVVVQNSDLSNQVLTDAFVYVDPSTLGVVPTSGSVTPSYTSLCPPAPVAPATSPSSSPPTRTAKSMNTIPPAPVTATTPRALRCTPSCRAISPI